MPLSELLDRHDPENAKDHDIGLLAMMLIKFGLVRLPAINEIDGLLLYGHGITTALSWLKKNRKDPPDGVVIDESGEWLVETDRGLRIAKRKAKAYRVGDNRSTERGGWNEPILAGVLLELVKTGELAGSAFETEEAERLVQIYIKGEDYSDLDKQLEELAGMEEITIELMVPKIHQETVEAWLSDGQDSTAAGRGVGVMIRCGLLLSIR
jgi:hypothetical protein